MEKTRKCTKCNIQKPIEEFSFSHRAKGYRRHECKECESNRHKSWFNANHARERHKQNLRYYDKRRNLKIPQEKRDRNREYQKRYRYKLKKIVFDHYGWKCACCGETEPLFLTIDHVNNDGYALRKYKSHPYGSNAQFWLWIINNDFPDYFQILCMNCNFGKARNGGICPHQEGSTTISKESTPKQVEAHRIPMG